MAVFLHELSHSLGHDDGSREFSDSLTILIQKCIDNNHSVKKYSREWDKGFKLSWLKYSLTVEVAYERWILLYLKKMSFKS